MGVRYTELYNNYSRKHKSCLVLATLLLVVLLFLYISPEQKCMRSEFQVSSSGFPISKVPTPLTPFAYRGVVESMDGRGFQFQKNEQVTLDPRFESFTSLPKCDDPQWNPSPVVDVPRVMATFKECIQAHIDSFKDENLWKIKHSWEKNTTVCEEKLDLSRLKIDEFKNHHETKWAVLPKCMEQHTMVTLGIGHDVNAELQLNRTLPNVKFYGADPIIEPNIQLYSQFGRFFPFAVGRKSGTDRFRVLPNQNQKTRKYVYQDVTTIEVVYVLKEIMQLSHIDFLWIDIEGAEKHFLDYFFKGGKFDEIGITVCQFNMEFHLGYLTDGLRGYYEFVDRLTKDGRYLFMKARTTGVGVFRMYFLNMENPKCLRKYIS